jgi:MFS family permease
VIAGTFINLVAVPAMALAHHWGIAAALIVLERAGKGIRTPARDVMLSQASHVVGRGWGFGLHEFMDQTGAFAGPLLVALAIREWHRYPAAYALLAIPAALALLALGGAMRLYPHPARLEERPAHPVSSTAGFPRAFWIFATAAALLAFGFVDFPLMAFHFQKTAVASAAMIPVFYSCAMGAEAFAALAFGRLFDRIGTAAIVAGVLLSAASGPLVFFGSFYPALGGMLLWGAGMGAQQSPLRAKIAGLVAIEKRGSAFGIFHSMYGVAWFAGSAAIGILYGRSLAVAVGLAVVAQLSAIPLLLIAGRKHS